MRITAPRAAVAVALALTLTACTSGGTTPYGAGPSTAPSPAASSPAATPAPGIVIQNFEFTGLPSVKPGETVTVTNLDGVSHTVSSDDGTSFRVVVAGGSAGTFTAPTKPGSYAYHCAFHRTMHAALLVKP